MLADTPRLSVLIPNLHCPRVGDTVNAALDQTGVDERLEVIVAGRDRHRVIPADARVRFIETERDYTPSEARNLAIREARGETILFLDADCVPEAGWMQQLLATHRAGHPIVGGALVFPREGFWSVADNISAAHGFLPSTPAGEPRGFHLSAANLCLPKRLLDEAGGFDETLVCGEDFDLMMRLGRLGYPMYFEPGARAAHRHGRRDLAGFLRHAAAWAPDSIVVRGRHADLLGTPWYLKSPHTLRLFSPLLALGASLRIWLRHPELVRDLPAFPAVLVAKFIWCWAAARGLELANSRSAAGRTS
ncbi:MAG: glycosyltransferase [Nitrospirota bacterium]|nr:glycosyltransferase [Nitrospirota bacterium]